MSRSSTTRPSSRTRCPTTTCCAGSPVNPEARVLHGAKDLTAMIERLPRIVGPSVGQDDARLEPGVAPGPADRLAHHRMGLAPTGRPGVRVGLSQTLGHKESDRDETTCSFVGPSWPCFTAFAIERGGSERIRERSGPGHADVNKEVSAKRIEEMRRIVKAFQTVAIEGAARKSPSR